MSGPSRLLPWLVAIVGLALPFWQGGGAGWPYVVGWLIVLSLAWLLRPLAGTSHRARVESALLCLVLLVWPGWIVGGPYLVPAALAWLALELLAPAAPSSPIEPDGLAANPPRR
jgi:hypothetical protein